MKEADILPDTCCIAKTACGICYMVGFA